MRKLFAAPARSDVSARSTAMLSAATSWLWCCPAPIMARAPIETGATSAVFDPYEGTFADQRFMLAETIVIAGDCSGADIRLGADRGVTKIGEMVGLGAGTECRLLHLDKITDLHAVFTFGAGTKPRIGTNDATRPKPACLQDARRPG